MVRVVFIFLLMLLVSGIGMAQVIVDEELALSEVEQSMTIAPTGVSQANAILSGKSDALFKAIDGREDLLKEDSVWMRLIVKNQLTKETNLFLGTSRFDYLDVYYRRDTTLSGPFSGGLKVPSSERMVPVPGYSFFELELGAGEEVVVYFLGRNATSNLVPQPTFPVSIMSKEYFGNHFERPGNYTYMFIGAALIMIFFNLLLFLLTKIRAYFYYTAYILNVTLFALALIPQFALPLYGHMDLNQAPISLTGVFTQFFYILVGREILEIPRIYPKIDRVLKIILGLLALSAILDLIFGNQMVSVIINYSTVLFSYPTLFVLGAVLAWKGHTAGKYFFIASSFYFTAVILMVFQLLGTLPAVLFGLTYSSIVEIGITMELALFGLGLGVRINEMRKSVVEKELEKERILREKEEERKAFLEEQNQSLELRVKERTAEVEAQKEALEKSLLDLKKAQLKLIESEKMASLGQLTAGVAHEINNPVNFISNGVKNLKANFDDIVFALKNFLNLHPETINKEAFQQVLDENEKHYVSDAIEDSESLFGSINNGVERTVSIVRSLRNFSRLDEGELKMVDLHEGLESTLEILQSQIKKKAIVIKNYGEIPKLLCMPGKINQAFLNIINNALQAMEERGELTITTSYQQIPDTITVAIGDNGKGMDEATKNRLFEPFFTTKPVGEGTGLGLAITYGIIEEHKGNIEVESAPGVGTTFTIHFPVNALKNE